MATADNGEPLAQNFRLISTSDQGGRPDGAQIMVHRGYGYIAHVFSNGFTVMDLRDPAHPHPVKFVPAFGNNWAVHLQTHEDLLLVINEYNFYGNPAFEHEADYYGRSIEESINAAGGESILGVRGVDYTAGMCIYDVSQPENPRLIGQLDVDGYGFHRIWYVGGRYAYVSAQLRGYTDHILLIVDMSDPTKPVEAGRWWLPGMWSGGGEDPTWPRGDRVALHHAIVAKDIAYASWRDGGLVILDVADPASPKLLSHRNFHPPFGGGTHTAVPLTDRVPVPKDYVIVADEAIRDNCLDQVKYNWVIDIREPSNPVPIATFPTPSERDYCQTGGHFGPHNLHENRPGSFQSSELIFGTYQNAGLRAFDISNPFAPQQVGCYVPAPTWETWSDGRPNRPRAVHSADLYVDVNGVVYFTDFNAGLHVVEFLGK